MGRPPRGRIASVRIHLRDRTPGRVRDAGTSAYMWSGVTVPPVAPPASAPGGVRVVVVIAVVGAVVASPSSAVTMHVLPGPTRRLSTREVLGPTHRAAREGGGDPALPSGRFGVMRGLPGWVERGRPYDGRAVAEGDQAGGNGPVRRPHRRGEDDRARPPRPQDEVTVVVVETRGWALSDAGATALAACGAATTIPVASMQVRAVASWERRVFRAARGRMRSNIKPSFSFSIPQSRRIIDDVP